MANPLLIYPIIDCKLQIENNGDKSSGSEKRAKEEYTLTNLDQFTLRDSSSAPETIKGFLSPKYDINLPRYAKKNAGIPNDAKRYAYLYPPDGLAELLDWEHYSNKVNSPNQLAFVCKFVNGLSKKIIETPHHFFFNPLTFQNDLQLQLYLMVSKHFLSIFAISCVTYLVIFIQRLCLL